jgi:hypothetical protein
MIRNAFFVLVLVGVIGFPAIAAELTNNGDGTVIDAATGLVWQQGEGGSKTWQAALSYCEELTLAGQSDWRLPNFKELQSIVDYTKSHPAIDKTVFSGANSSYYWSSTTYASGAGLAWYVGFSSGYVYYDDKTNSSYVRCVRGGQ